MDPNIPAMPWWAIVGVIVVLLVLARGLLKKSAAQPGSKPPEQGE